MHILKAAAAAHVILIGTMLALVSCKTTNARLSSIITKQPPQMPAPLWETFFSIYQEPYVLHENDCSNKAAKYLRALDEAGYTAALVVIKSHVAMAAAAASGDEDAIIHHVVVRVTFQNGSVYYDPTNNSGSENLDFFGIYCFEMDYETIKATDSKHWQKEFKINE
jgi:hypothetical protein